MFTNFGKEFEQENLVRKEIDRNTKKVTYTPLPGVDLNEVGTNLCKQMFGSTYELWLKRVGNAQRFLERMYWPGVDTAEAATFAGIIPDENGMLSPSQLEGVDAKMLFKIMRLRESTSGNSEEEQSKVIKGITLTQKIANEYAKSGAFYDARIDFPLTVDLSQVTNAEKLFHGMKAKQGCLKLTGCGGIKNACWMFSNAEIADDMVLDMPELTTALGMFQGATIHGLKLTAPKMEAATDMFKGADCCGFIPTFPAAVGCAGMFESYRNAVKVGDLSKNFPKAKSMASMFYEAKVVLEAEVTIPESCDDTDSMFSHAEIAQGSAKWVSVSMKGVTTADQMFCFCGGVNLSIGPVDAPKLETAVGMFKDFRTLQRVANFKGNVEDATSMFENCSGMRSLPMPYWILDKDNVGSDNMFINTPLSSIYGVKGERLAEMTRFFRQKTNNAPAAPQAS